MKQLFAIFLFFTLTGFLAGHHHQVKLVEEPSIHLNEQEHLKLEPLDLTAAGAEAFSTSVLLVIWTALLVLLVLRPFKLIFFLFPVFYQSNYFSDIRLTSS